ncbi:MAG: iron-containing alcohol dehydrogenase [Propionibacteriaceae bacterium]|jgi:glycerol-1-phosphate dehydrogenase [NAD(P)+]|nr:iron-containing alcohol dehydrogenase [Propionibacteriaceae bacterium]
MSYELTPGPLDGFYEHMSRLAGVRRQQRMTEIVMSDTALEEVVRVVLDGRDRADVLIVQDRTDIKRAGQSIKPALAEALRQAGCAVQTLVLSDDHELHTTPAHISEVEAVLRPGLTVLSLGSGTITDLSKHGVFEFEAKGNPDLRLVCVQTANSVCAYTSDQAPITFGRVKRTLPSRLPDALVIDTQLLFDAPLEYTNGGIGDAAVAAVTFADYLLGHRLGLGKWEPLSLETMTFSMNRLLARDPVLGPHTPAKMGAIAQDLAATGLAIGFAGESAPLSGLEHVTSHTLDMSAEYDHRPVGNHGSQCGLAAILSLIAFDRLIDQADLSGLDPDRIDPVAERDKVERAFGFLDPSGETWGECWNDFSAKIEAWRRGREQIMAVLGQWDDLRAELRRLSPKPEVYVAALAATGHPLRFTEIPTGITWERARWAFTNARLMRKRTSVADVLGFAGLWTEELLDDIFETYFGLIAPYTD